MNLKLSDDQLLSLMSGQITYTFPAQRGGLHGERIPEATPIFDQLTAERR